MMIFFEYEKYDTRQDAVNYIKKSDKLELRKLDINKCKAWSMNDTDTIIAESERQALDWYMDYTGYNFDETLCEECSLNETYEDGETNDMITIGDGVEEYFANEVVTEPFIICSTEW